MKGYLQLVKLSFFYRKHAIIVIISNIFYVIFNLLSLVLFIPFLKLIFDPEEIEVVAKPSWESRETLFQYFGDYFEYWKSDFVANEGPLRALTFICISVILAFFFKNLFRYIAVYYQSFPRMAVVRDLRARLFNKALRLPLSYYSEEKKGDLLSRMSNDLNEIEVAVVAVLEMIFREPLSIILSLSVLFYMSVPLTFFSLILLPVSALIISQIGRSLKRTSKKGQKEMGQLLAVIEESLGGIRIIKAFIAEKIAFNRFEQKNNHHQKLLTRAFRKGDLSSPLSEFMGAVVLVCIVWYGGKLVLQSMEEPDANIMTGEQFIAYIVVFSQLLRPISGFTKGLTSLKKAEASLDRLNEIVDIEEKIVEPLNPIKPEEFKEAVVFENVTFDYGGDPVLKGVSLTIKKGQSIALVGESGSGKSTLADLLPRFHDVVSGSIRIDGVDVRNMLTSDLRKMVSIVSQESILFNDSIANNIALSNPNASRQEIEAAAKVANAHDFISGLSEGYDTNIGDRGNKLSGGQKQRISIARAVLSNAPIMILDEATSALDTESELVVQKALESVMKNRTSLVIAHRLSTIRNADQIIVMKKGEVVEQGTHQELIDQNGYYKSLCEVQQVL